MNWGKRESELEKKLKKKAEEITLFFKNVTSFFSEAFKRDRNSYLHFNLFIFSILTFFETQMLALEGRRLTLF